jgi:hypothetical protein
VGVDQAHASAARRASGSWAMGLLMMSKIDIAAIEAA